MINKNLQSKIKQYKNELILLFVVSFMSITIGALVHNKIDPNWDIIKDLELNDNINNDINIYDFYLPKVRENFERLLKKELENFNIDNKNFNSLKNIKVTNKFLRYNTNQKEKSDEDSEIYINNLNIYLSKNLEKKLNLLSEKAIKNLSIDINNKFQGFHEFIDIIEDSDLYNDQLDREDKNLSFLLKDNKENRLEELFGVDVSINSLTDFKTFTEIFKKPSVVEKIIKYKPIVNDYRDLKNLINSNYEILNFTTRYKSLNRQPTKVLFSIAIMLTTIFIFLIFISIKNTFFKKL